MCIPRCAITDRQQWWLGRQAAEGELGVVLVHLLVCCCCHQCDEPRSDVKTDFLALTHKNSKEKRENIK